MFNTIRMELYRMWKTRSLYILWIVMAVLILFTTNLNASDWKSYTEAEQQENYEFTQEATKLENINIGMNVNIPTKQGEEVTVFDSAYANLQGKFIALFMVIFAVLYSMADMTSGYVKNVAGQMKHRENLIAAKAVALFVFTVCTMGVYVLVQVISNVICFGSLAWGTWSEFLSYLGIQTLLHFALNLIAMMLAIVIHNNVFSITLVICICMNLMTILYSGVDKLIMKMGTADFHLISYTVTGKISMLGMKNSCREIAIAAIVSLAFGLISLVISSVVVRKRDI